MSDKKRIISLLVNLLLSLVNLLTLLYGFYKQDNYFLGMSFGLSLALGLPGALSFLLGDEK